MTGTAITLGKRTVTDRKQQGLIRTAMGIMTGKTGIGLRKDSLVDRGKSFAFDIMAVGTKLSPVLYQISPVF